MPYKTSHILQFLKLASNVDLPSSCLSGRYSLQALEQIFGICMLKAQYDYETRRSGGLLITSDYLGFFNEHPMHGTQALLPNIYMIWVPWDIQT